MNFYELENNDMHSDFDDRMDCEEVYQEDDSDEIKPMKEEESFYRHLEEY